MLFLQLFYTFFKIGLFSFGGAYSMFALMQDEIVYRQTLMSSAEFLNLMSLGQLTPGSTCINAATYCGYTVLHNAGMGAGMAVLGSITALIALLLPSFIIATVFCRLLMRYVKSPVMLSIMSGLRPAVVGLMLAAVSFGLFNKENFSSLDINPWYFCVNMFILIASFIGIAFMRISPIRMICWAAFAGLMLL